MSNHGVWLAVRQAAEYSVQRVRRERMRRAILATLVVAGAAILGWLALRGR